MTISIIIPVFNEESNLLLQYNEITFALSASSRDYEIIFIDDGSTDRSGEILLKMRDADKRLKIITFNKNYGKTSALAAGFREAEGEYMLTMDADLQYDANDLLRLVKELESNDIALGYRINRLAVDGMVKFLSSKAANYARNMLLGEKFNDVACICGYRKECINDLKLYRGFQVFIVSLLAARGYRIKQLPVKIRPRIHGKSKYNISNRLFKEFLALLVVKWLKKNTLIYKTRE